ncbi:carboxylesterase type B [Microthyrium microscopicum]|uniref:Carboxylic ester hydrolase n=1 Tax=Microthyrium microscopicum TaxID=703497 RepID=A0A6A6UPI9_9PEZI|nr:carboxylesterase type B [Microthyrium microscopicum]
MRKSHSSIFVGRLVMLHIVLAFMTIVPGALTATDPAVTTTHGPIVGFQDSGIQVFKNIPYGADTSTTRFKAPKPPNPWTEPKHCTKYGPIAPQPGSDKESSGHKGSEDCLNLNVWTPASDNNTRPVLVYFHGGGYDSGTVNEDTYDGRRLAQKRDVVVVTVSHRINGLGYMYLGGISKDYETGNPGQLDLILALKWVRDNIERFGGDKNSVTIFGQSGGGAKCATLMAMPEAKGLFHRVWTMSGQQITGRTLEHAKQTAQEVLSKIEGESDAEKLEQLVNMPMAELQTTLAGGGQRWAPVTSTSSLPKDPFFPTANEQSRNIPMVIGNTYGETRNLIGGSKGRLFNLTWDQVPSQLEKSVKNFIGNLSGETIVSEYRKHYPSYSPSDVFFAATTAARSWKSMLVESDIRAKHPDSPLWVYYLRWKTPFEDGRMGAAHGFDIPLVFANPDAFRQMRGFESAEVMAETVSKALVHFARTGTPKIEGSDMYWPRYELGERLSMIFDLPASEIHSDDRGWERRFFASIPYTQPGT